ncbi:ATP-grasp domain-containing protein [Edaphovirga cremea]|uniref:ATP-grasp domain-containing protein n=1 Tax=Edaphovirga cremea TaxID=2267246 RepID=UPI000DEEF7DE|nr:ATP-grasp domain-containing protein [Edaphovirga cremea]
MQIIYPDDFSNQARPDEIFEQEYLCAQQNRIHCLLLNSEAAAMGKYKFSGVFEPDIPVIWRGWMLNVDEYRLLHQAVTGRGGKMLESVEDYIGNHHITGWYERCKAYTPETVITTPDADFEALTSQLQWPAYFVKDYVKSLTTSRGSVAKDAGEIREVIRLIEHYRGNIEGGVSLRRFESLVKDSERRYFVLNGRVFSADDRVPELVSEIARRVDTPFYSIDVAENSAGELRLIEIGDGQVSDIKEWGVERFVSVFRVQ